MLRQVDVTMVKNDVCVQKYIYMDPEVQLCAGVNDGLSNVCKGDSGGGLFCKNANSRWYLAGIVSYGLECREGAVYTRVSAYVNDWIEEKIKNN